jgi:hypothetical protein
MKNEVYRQSAGPLPLVMQTPLHPEKLQRHMVSTRSYDDLLTEPTDASTRQNVMKFGKEDYSSCTSLKKPYESKTENESNNFMSPLLKKENEF